MLFVGAASAAIQATQRLQIIAAEAAPHIAISMRTNPVGGALAATTMNLPASRPRPLLQKSGDAQRQSPTQLGARVPVRRPSGGVAQGDEPHGCGERLKGPWTALVSRPPERHRREGSLAAGQTRMSGWPSLWLLSLGRGGHPQARESDSP